MIMECSRTKKKCLGSPRSDTSRPMKLNTERRSVWAQLNSGWRVTHHQFNSGDASPCSRPKQRVYGDASPVASSKLVTRHPIEERNSEKSGDASPKPSTKWVTRHQTRKGRGLGQRSRISPIKRPITLHKSDTTSYITSTHENSQP